MDSAICRPTLAQPLYPLSRNDDQGSGFKCSLLPMYRNIWRDAHCGNEVQVFLVAALLLVNCVV